MTNLRNIIKWSHLLLYLIYILTRVKLITVRRLVLHSICALFEMADRELWYLMSVQCLKQEITQSSEFCSRALPVLDLIIFTTFLCMSCTTLKEHWVYTPQRGYRTSCRQPLLFFEWVYSNKHVVLSCRWVKNERIVKEVVGQNSVNALGCRSYMSCSNVQDDKVRSLWFTSFLFFL